MGSKKHPALKGYDKAIIAAKELYKSKFGKEHGALTWFAREVGMSRQLLDICAVRSGFPHRFVPKVAKLLNMRQSEVRPETVTLVMPKTTFNILKSSVPHLIDECAIIPERKSSDG